MKNFNIRSCYYFLTPAPEHDFEDDGTRFRGFRYSPDGKRELICTYASDKDSIYLAARLDYTKIPYDFYRDFEGRDPDKFNGMSKDDPELTPENIRVTLDKVFHLLHDEIAPAWEVEKARVYSPENTVLIKNRFLEIANKVERDLNDLFTRFTIDDVLKLSEYQFKRIKDYKKSVKSRIDHLRRIAEVGCSYCDAKKILAGEDPYIGVDFYFKDLEKTLSGKSAW